MNDADFLRALANEPTNDDLRLVYADWLEERCDAVASARAEFLRITVQLAAPKAGTKGWRKGRRRRLRALAASLDTEWMGVVSHLTIENCFDKRRDPNLSRQPGMFDFICDRQWQQLRPTADNAVRHCEGCGQDVHYCDTITTARGHAAQQHCVAIDLGVIRREGDLRPPLMLLGRPSTAFLRREEERMRPDPVSAERERMKRERSPEEA